MLFQGFIKKYEKGIMTFSGVIAIVIVVHFVTKSRSNIIQTKKNKLEIEYFRKMLGKSEDEK